MAIRISCRAADGASVWYPYRVDSPILEMWFVNQNASVDVLGIASHEQLDYLPADGDSDRRTAQKQRALATVLEGVLKADPPRELQRSILTSGIEPGAMVSVEQAFYFNKSAEPGRVLMRTKLDTDPTWKIEGKLDPSRFAFSSAHDHLSGKRNVFVVATVSDVDIEERIVTLRPLFVGHRSWATSRSTTPIRSRRIYPSHVDHFSDVDWARGPSAKEMKIMHNMREHDVKTALAEIIGTPFVGKDWGGERSDLVSNNMMVDGDQVSASWLLKGRSVQGAMKIPHLGSNGDQIERLTTEDSDLLIVQHNNAITAAVVNLAAAFANDMRKPRRYMILDGEATAMILRDYNKLDDGS